MNRSRRRIWERAAALAAAYALVLQALFGAFALGTGSAAAGVDAFGGVICTHDGAATPPAGDGKDHGQDHQPSCCIPGCAFFASALGPAPYGAFLLAPVLAEAGAAAPPDAVRALFSRHRWQANPRAPPAA